jgi:hypothetical protein
MKRMGRADFSPNLIGPAQSTAYRSLFQIQPDLSALDNKYQKVRAGFMMYVTTISVRGLTPTEYRAVLDKMGVETHPDAHIFLHLTTPMESGFRVIEIWDDKEAFEGFLKNRLGPANEVIGITHAADITIEPLHNFFAPRLDELPGVISSLPGSPGFRSPE